MNESSLGQHALGSQVLGIDRGDDFTKSMLALPVGDHRGHCLGSEPLPPRLAPQGVFDLRLRLATRMHQPDKPHHRV